MRARDLRCRPLLLLGLALGAGGACGDPLLPSDFAGPPASAVGGNVVRPGVQGSKDVERPGLSLQWLAGNGPEVATGQAALIGQPLAYQRSVKLDKDWDIGLQLPTDGARFSTEFAGRTPVRLSVGKMVYFDDRVPDGRLEWGCGGGTCDFVKAVSIEYVVYVEVPPVCYSPTGGPRARVAPGYHYYRFEGGSVRELARGEDMSFVVGEQPFVEADLSAELRAFTAALLRSWSIGPFESC